MLVRPRLTDYHNVHIPQSELDFAIPFLDEDIPLYVDPFLLWKSPSQQDQALHGALVSAFNHLGHLATSGDRATATEQLIAASECDEVGLGTSATRSGKRFGPKLAGRILSLFEQVEHYRLHGFRHIEELQLLIAGVSRDRISDLACCFLKSFLIDFTHQECERTGIPMRDVRVSGVYHLTSGRFRAVQAELPVHPVTGNPILLVPKRWLRHVPWINYDTYFRHHCPQDDVAHEGEELTRVKVLSYNRDNYGLVDSFVRERERTQADCANDPLFLQIPVLSARRKFAAIRRLPTGNKDKADRKYEDNIAVLFASLFYPQLDFAEPQSHTDSGVSIRDLVFYNTRTDEFLREIMDDYGSRQIVMEMKNVERVDRYHIDQLNRYLHDELGKFGVLVTRHELKRAEHRRVVDLWSGQRKAIVTLTDMDVEQMVEVFESRQRAPLDVLKKKYAQFRRACP